MLLEEILRIGEILVIAAVPDEIDGAWRGLIPQKLCGKIDEQISAFANVLCANVQDHKGVVLDVQILAQHLATFGAGQGSKALFQQALPANGHL